MFMSYKKGFVWASFFLFINCSHYSPVSVGHGEPSNLQVESCTDYILGFPTFGERRRLDTLLRANNLTPEDVATLESRSWFYLFPFYGKGCTIVSLNKKGAQKTNTNAMAIEISPKTAIPSVFDPSKNCNEKTGDLFFRNTKISCIEACQQVHPLNQKKCREAYSRKFNIKIY